MLALRLDLVGFDQKELDLLIPKLIEAISRNTGLKDKIYLVCHPGTKCFSVADSSKPIQLISLNNSNAAGTSEQLIKLREVLESFGCYVEYEAASGLIRN